MPWALLIQALQAVLVVAIQQIGRRHNSANDLVDETVLTQLDPHQRDALCKLGAMHSQPGAASEAP
jgi:hypothetical protein